MKSMRVAAALGAVLALLAVVAAALVGTGPAAGAQEYGAVCSVAASYDEGTGILRVVGTGLEPGFTTPIVLDGETIGEATADASGNFDVEIAIALTDVEIAADEISPAAVYTVSILCNGDGDQSSTTVTLSNQSAVVHVIEPSTIDCAGNLRGFAEGVRPGTEVSFTLDHTGTVVATVEADETGRADYAAVVDLAAGSYTVTARGQDAFGDPFTLTSSFTAPSGCEDLPRTGTDSAGLALTGVIAVALGSLTLLVARRRSADA